MDCTATIGTYIEFYDPCLHHGNRKRRAANFILFILRVEHARAASPCT